MVDLRLEYKIAQLLLASFVDFEKPEPPNDEGITSLEQAVAIVR